MREEGEQDKGVTLTSTSPTTGEPWLLTDTELHNVLVCRNKDRVPGICGVVFPQLPDASAPPAWAPAPDEAQDNG